MKIVFAALVALTLGSPIWAADFSGPRIEANIGWDHPRLKVDLDDLSAHGHDDGVVYGGEAGYDLRFGRLVVGALAGIDGSSAKGCATTDPFRNCLKQGRDWAVGARVGAVVAPRTLLYAKGEYTNVRLKDAFDGAGALSTHDNRGGYRLGAGVEFALTSNVYVKGEYRYSDYGHDRIDDGTDVGRADLSRHQVVGGVGLRF